MLMNTNLRPDPQKETNTPEEAAKIDRSIKILGLVVAALVVVFLFNMIATNIIRPSMNYSGGTKAMQAGNYADAIDYFTNAGDYKDAPDLLLKAKQSYANLLAGKENAISYTSDTMKWFKIDGDGMFSFVKDDYEEAEEYLPNPGEIIIPDVLDGKLVASIKEKTFLNADTVTSIVIPDGVKEIPDSCFYNCTALQSITLPAGLVSLSQRAFINCTALTALTLPETVASIGLRAFNSCYMLTSVTIGGELLTTIEPYTFSDCVSLAEVTLPASVTTIKENAFLNCTALKTIYFGGTEAAWNAIAVSEGNEVLDNVTVICKTDKMIQN